MKDAELSLNKDFSSTLHQLSKNVGDNKVIRLLKDKNIIL